MRKILIAAPALAAAALPFAAAAQAPASDRNGANRLAEEYGERSFRTGLDDAVSNGPNDRELKSTGVPDFQLVATSEEKVVTMAVTSKLSGSVNAAGDRYFYHQFSLKAAAEVEDGDGPMRIFGLKGFAGGTEVTLNYTYFTGKLNVSAIDRLAEASFPRAAAECRRQNAGLLALEMVQGKASQGAGDGEDKPDPCDPDNFDQGLTRFLELYDPSELHRLLDEIFPSRIFFAGIEASGSQDDYEYLDATTRETDKASKFGFKSNLFAGFLFPKRAASIAASVTFAKEYEAGTEFNACNPADASDCATGPGLPKATKRAIGSIEGRWAFGAADGKPAPFALAPEASYDFKNKAFSLDVPLYFARDGDGKLRGGVRFTYLDERDPMGGRRRDKTLSLFVGVPFALFGGL